MNSFLYILNGGLKHYSLHSNTFYYDEKKNILYPKDRASELYNSDEIVIVDSNIATGRTIMRTIEKLNLKDKNVIIKGNTKTEFAKKLIDIEVESADPESKYILAFAGKAASLKSFITKSLSECHKIPLIQVGKELKKVTNIGNYGEVLFKKEKDNPFLVGELLYPKLKKYKSTVIILDGIKNIESLTLLSLSTRRPAFLFYVKINENLRKKALKYREDSDDRFAAEREKMFRKRLRELEAKAYSVIDMDDWSSFSDLCKVLEGLGFRTSFICGFPNPFGSKLPILELYKRNTEKLANKNIKERLSRYVFHRSYLDRLKGYNLNKKQKENITLIATAFRIIDDILDEHEIRDFNRTFWKEHGITKSIFIASLMSAKAWQIAKEVRVESEFEEMFKSVINAVKYEILNEEQKIELRGFLDWVKVAEREAKFREYLATITGEDRKNFYKKGLIAQAKDDIYGKSKKGRENTDDKLKRFLFKTEWTCLLSELR